MPLRTPSSSRGFTLIELVIVVVIVAILSAIAMPRFRNAAENARFSAAYSSFKTLQTAFETYSADTRAWPIDAAPGVMPAGMASYIQPTLWTNVTPFGGVWDYNGTGGSSLDGKVNISVYAPEAGLHGVFCRFDTTIDNNNCGSGQFRASGERSFKSLE